MAGLFKTEEVLKETTNGPCTLYYSDRNRYEQPT